MGYNYENEINKLLEMIDRKIQKYEKYPEGADIGQLIQDRVEQSKKEIIGKEYLLDRIRNRVKEREELKKLKGLNYFEKELWPEVNQEEMNGGTKDIPVQVNGKLKGCVTVPADATAEEILNFIKEDNQVKELKEKYDVKKEIYIPGRIYNLVVINK